MFVGMGTRKLQLAILVMTVKAFGQQLPRRILSISSRIALFSGIPCSSMDCDNLPTRMLKRSKKLQETLKSIHTQTP